MARKIIWTRKAADSLESIFEYIWAESPFYAKQTIKDIHAVIASIKEHPQMGRKVPEINNEQYRERVYRNYRIVYFLDEAHIELLLIHHSARPLSDPRV